MADRFQERFQALLRGGMLVSEARNAALREMGRGAAIVAQREFVFRPGDCIRLSRYGQEQWPNADPQRTATIVSVTRTGLLRLIKDGNRRTDTYHPSFWEPTP